MWKSLGARGSVFLVLAVAVWLGGSGQVHARGNPFDPPGVQKPPPPVVDCQGCQCTNSCGCTGPNCGTPPGGGSHMPEPCTLISGLIGAGLASVYGWRRRKQATAE
jgi:hypothetical protein